MKNRQKTSNMPIYRYSSFQKKFSFKLPNRKWPNNYIEKAPRWCSVDLRDGNQALINPMDYQRKYKMFKLLIDIGYKEIEVGFPSASDTDFWFIRQLIKKQLIPHDVTIQVLTQARKHLIKRTYQALKGVNKAIIHIYNSTSILQRKIVFKKNKQGIIDIALRGAELCKSFEKKILRDSKITYEYSPESFTGTELKFALKISDLISEVFEVSSKNKMILNLPATVEISTPNIYADSVEWICDNLKNRNHFIISLHPHNDRGTAIAAAELGYLAGADRIEGCLFGNGERTGNADLVTLGLNLFSQGIDPKIDFSNLDYIKKTAEYCNQYYLDKRMPYSGELVFTAFSGSHQDAIKKGFEYMKSKSVKKNIDIKDLCWEIPYLPIDPKDIGRNYKAIIRVNSQSGKSGIAYLLQNEYNIHLPKRAQIEFSALIQSFVDLSGKEIDSEKLWSIFSNEYLSQEDAFLVRKTTNSRINKNFDNQINKNDFYNLLSFKTTSDESSNFLINIKMNKQNILKNYSGKGNGPIDAFINILRNDGIELRIMDYIGHALSSGENAIAAAYVECKLNNKVLWGIGIDSNTIKASFKAIISAINRYFRISSL